MAHFAGNPEPSDGLSILEIIGIAALTIFWPVYIFWIFSMEPEIVVNDDRFRIVGGKRWFTKDDIVSYYRNHNGHYLLRIDSLNRWYRFAAYDDHLKGPVIVLHSDMPELAELVTVLLGIDSDDSQMLQ